MIGEHEAYCQPCVSPVWDTALTCHALLGGRRRRHAREDEAGPRLAEAAAGARPQGRLGGEAPRCPPGRLGVPVQQRLLSRSRRHRGRRDGDGPRAAGTSGSNEYDAAISRGREWIEGLQSRDGGWAAFDVDNLEYYLNNIPFSDHGALLDPPTEDVTARCISMLAQLGETRATSKAVRTGRLSAPHPARRRVWYGRWGLNYVYGTWSVLCALNAAGVTTRTR